MLSINLRVPVEQAWAGAEHTAEKEGRKEKRTVFGFWGGFFKVFF